jgi:hypothetical protein
MPTRTEALRFAGDPRTTAEQLRRACTLLGLDADGDVGALRDRLLAHLGGVEDHEPVVCLNPGPAAPEPGVSRPG